MHAQLLREARGILDAQTELTVQQDLTLAQKEQVRFPHRASQERRSHRSYDGLGCRSC